MQLGARHSFRCGSFATVCYDKTAGIFHPVVRQFRTLTSSPERQGIPLLELTGERWTSRVNPMTDDRSRRTRLALSEIRLVGVRHRLHIIVEKVDIVFSANFLAQRTLLDAPVTLERGPRRREGAGVLDIGDRFQRFSALDDAVALDDMQLVGVRRAITIDEGPGGEPDRVAPPAYRRFRSGLWNPQTMTA